jgi:hypothetical protein
MVMAAWMLQRQHPARLTIWNYARQKQLLEDMRCSLPVPSGRLEIWLVTRILSWLDRESDALRTLQLANVVATMVVTVERR